MGLKLINRILLFAFFFHFTLYSKYALSIICLLQELALKCNYA